MLNSYFGTIYLLRNSLFVKNVEWLWNWMFNMQQLPQLCTYHFIKLLKNLKNKIQYWIFKWIFSFWHWPNKGNEFLKFDFYILRRRRFIQMFLYSWRTRRSVIVPLKEGMNERCYKIILTASFPTSSTTSEPYVEPVLLMCIFKVLISKILSENH